MRFAAIDIGNTTIKFTLLGDDAVKVWVSDIASLEAAAKLCSSYGAEIVSFCTTRNLTPEEIELTREKGWKEFSSMGNLPLTVAYDTPATLGPDRLAAAVGAWKFYPGSTVLVADLGTALTLDIVSDKGVFIGGNISAGIAMRLKALHKFTSRLPEVELKGEYTVFGTDTRSAMLNGAVLGVVAEIAGASALALRMHDCRQLVVTGGAADTIYRKLDVLLPMEVRKDYQPDLLAFGLQEIYKYNN